jgi:CRP-like cAMP-binding protein
MFDDTESSQNSHTVIKFLQHKHNFSIFDDMSDADILAITKNIIFNKYNPGDILIKEGDFGTRIYCVIKGKCNIIANKRIIGGFGNNTLLGEVASLTKSRRIATVRSIEETVTFEFEINYDKADDCSVSFAKYYKNIALILIKKLEDANK